MKIPPQKIHPLATKVWNHCKAYKDSLDRDRHEIYITELITAVIAEIQDEARQLVNEAQRRSTRINALQREITRRSRRWQAERKKLVERAERVEYKLQATEGRLEMAEKKLKAIGQSALSHPDIMDS